MRGADNIDDLRRRLGKATAAAKLLRPFFRHGNIPTKWKIKVYSSIFVAMVLYSMNTTWLNSAQLHKLDTFHYRIVRSILNIPFSVPAKTLS